MVGAWPHTMSDSPCSRLRERSIAMTVGQHVSRGIHEAVIQDMRSAMRGEFLEPGDATYDAARTVWNGMIDRRPAFIARCRGTADVIAAVNFAREHRLLVS